MLAEDQQASFPRQEVRLRDVNASHLLVMTACEWALAGASTLVTSAALYSVPYDALQLGVSKA